MTALIYKPTFPIPTQGDAGEVLVLNEAGTAYELEPAQSGATVDWAAVRADDGIGISSGEAPYTNGPGSLAIMVTDGEGVYATMDMTPDGNISLAGVDVQIGGAAGSSFVVSSESIAFFGVGAVTRPTGVAVTPEAIHAALVSLGLIAGP